MMMFALRCFVFLVFIAFTIVTRKEFKKRSQNSVISRTWYALSLLLCIGAVGLSGCASSPQTIAYKTLASVGNGVDSAEKAYLDLIVRGDIPTTSFVTVQKDYNTFQRDFAAALVIAEGSTNAVAPALLVTESASFIAETSNLK